ncbi:MAG: hypothetical protein JXR68_06565 [Bacteroidales bacterium]|nr:hypothetical protein [Bacteroidales bacterium]
MSVYKKISDFVYDCSVCPNRCDGVSKGSYIFKNDVQFSEYYENLIIDRINMNKNYTAYKCSKDGYPDIQIIDNNTKKLFLYIEVKVQRRTFMSVQRILPQSNLLPSETLALNLSDLLRYFKIHEAEKIPTNILWVLLNRPCILKSEQIAYYYQSVEKLQLIYNKCTTKRRFKRQSGAGDVVNGVHKGVVVNYHFSLKELKKWNK